MAHSALKRFDWQNDHVMGRVEQVIQESASPQVVITCPSCSTRFALEPELLSGVESPRFHCSRCDNLFTFEHQSAPPPLPLFVEELHDAHVPVEDLTAVTSPAIPSLLSPMPQITETRTAPQQNGWSLDIPRNIEPPVLVTPPHESHQTQDLTSMSWDAHEPQMQFSFLTKKTAEAAPQHDLSAASASSRERTAVPQLKETARQKFSSHSQLLLDAVHQLRGRIDSGRHEFLLTLILPLGICAALLACTAVFFRSFPATADNFTSSVIGSTTIPAPEGILIREVRYRKVTLDSGDTVFVLSGKILNSSERALREVQLEGLLFNDQGAMIGSRLTVAGSALARSKLKALTPDMIEEVQLQGVDRKSAVKKGEQIPFTVIFPPSEVQQARFFSARIYSAK